MKNKIKILLAFGLIFIVIKVIFLININFKHIEDLPFPEEQIPLVAKVDIEQINSQNKINSVTESNIKRESGTEDRFFNELLEKDSLLLSNSIEQKIELKKTLDNLIEHDKRLNKKWDLPDDVAKKIATDKLLLHFITSPMVATIVLNDDLELAVQRLLNSSNTLNEFFMREDMAEGTLKILREFDLSPESISDEYMIEKFSQTQKSRESPLLQRSLQPENILKTKISHLSLNIMYADDILLSPQFFPKLKGHEIEYLNALIDRYEYISKLQEIYGEDFAPALREVPTLCVKLAKNLDEQFYNTLYNNKITNNAERKRFYEDVKNFLEKQKEEN